ncbi:hypothetical protein L1987_00181 [Smallanthus sonchifolius]|uniref:Uncharacterized protein n=1 Tax=Smallanthus sonchifolius TaxID=185202 RepID=A0ACB9K1L9_9ASTR|nr:hypothetical protein L1987_00181 [Smallanthus sonchifolius]
MRRKKTVSRASGDLSSPFSSKEETGEVCPLPGGIPAELGGELDEIGPLPGGIPAELGGELDEIGQLPGDIAPEVGPNEDEDYVEGEMIVYKPPLLSRVHHL